MSKWRDRGPTWAFQCHIAFNPNPGIKRSTGFGFGLDSFNSLELTGSEAGIQQWMVVSESTETVSGWSPAETKERRNMELMRETMLNPIFDWEELWKDWRNVCICVLWLVTWCVRRECLIIRREERGVLLVRCKMEQSRLDVDWESVRWPEVKLIEFNWTLGQSSS